MKSFYFLEMSEKLKILLGLKREKLRIMSIKDTIKLPIRPKRHPLFGNYQLIIGNIIY
jgi:hypothetical protein